MAKGDYWAIACAIGAIAMGIIEVMYPQIPKLIGWPIVGALLLICAILVYIGMRTRGSESEGKVGDIRKLIKKLGTETISVLYEFMSQLVREGIQIGGIGKIQDALERAYLYKVVDKKYQAGYHGYENWFWVPTETGKNLINYLEANPPASYKGNPQTIESKLEIEVIEVKIEDNHGYNPTMIIVDAIFKPNKKMQISKVSLEWTETLSVEFDSSSVKLPDDTDINKHIELKYKIHTHSDNWYVLWEGKQGYLAPDKRTKGRLIVMADGKERKSEYFSIPKYKE